MAEKTYMVHTLDNLGYPYIPFNYIGKSLAGYDLPFTPVTQKQTKKKYEAYISGGSHTQDTASGHFISAGLYLDKLGHLGGGMMQRTFKNDPFLAGSQQSQYTEKYDPVKIDSRSTEAKATLNYSVELPLFGLGPKVLLGGNYGVVAKKADPTGQKPETVQRDSYDAGIAFRNILDIPVLRGFMIGGGVLDSGPKYTLTRSVVDPETLEPRFSYEEHKIPNTMTFGHLRWRSENERFTVAATYKHGVHGQGKIINSGIEIEWWRGNYFRSSLSGGYTFQDIYPGPQHFINGDLRFAIHTFEPVGRTAAIDTAPIEPRSTGPVLRFIAERKALPDTVTVDMTLREPSTVIKVPFYVTLVTLTKKHPHHAEGPGEKYYPPHIEVPMIKGSKGAKVQIVDYTGTLVHEDLVCSGINSERKKYYFSPTVPIKEGYFYRYQYCRDEKCTQPIGEWQDGASFDVRPYGGRQQHYTLNVKKEAMYFVLQNREQARALSCFLLPRAVEQQSTFVTNAVGEEAELARLRADRRHLSRVHGQYLACIKDFLEEQIKREFKDNQGRSLSGSELAREVKLRLKALELPDSAPDAGIELERLPFNKPETYIAAVSFEQDQNKWPAGYHQRPVKITLPYDEAVMNIMSKTSEEQAAFLYKKRYGVSKDTGVPPDQYDHSQLNSLGQYQAGMGA